MTEEPTTITTNAETQPATWMISALKASFVSVPGYEVPGYYRRTYMLGLLLGWIATAIAGLFDYDTEAWVWSKSSGFRPFIFTKRGKLAAPADFHFPGTKGTLDETITSRDHFILPSMGVQKGADNA